MEAFKIQFIGEIEKHPSLYNYTISEYCKKDLLNKAWHDVIKDGQNTNNTIYT